MKDQIKNAGKVAGILLAAGLTSEADAGRLYITAVPKSFLGRNEIGLVHYSGASDGEDSRDGSYLAAPSPYIDIFSKTNFNYPKDSLRGDCRSLNSTSNFLVPVSGRGLANSEDTDFRFRFSYFLGEDNFSWKNLVVELYNAGDINDKKNLLGTYDAHALAEGNAAFPTLQVDNGLSYQIVVKPRNWADFNLDNRVNLIDGAILGRYWLSNDPNSAAVGGQNYTDINRDGGVGTADLSILGSEWLFEGCDPNTFVKNATERQYFNDMAGLAGKYKGFSKDKGIQALASNANLEERAGMNAYDRKALARGRSRKETV
jgi:hypothetical protein